MDHGVSPGIDFFEYDSSEGEGHVDNDEADWEDDNGTRIFSEVEGLGIHGFTDDAFISSDRDRGDITLNKGEERGRQWQRNVLTALPPYNQLPTHDSRTGMSANERALEDSDSRRDTLAEQKGTRKARQMSLRRLGKVRLVHNRTSSSASGNNSAPRNSSLSSNSEALSLPSPLAHRGDSKGFTSRHRRNASESLTAFLHTHAMTIRAIENIAPSARLSLAHELNLSPSKHTSHPVSPSNPSVRASRRVHIADIDTRDKGRPEHLPAHFVKTPCPFSKQKEFPRPRTRPKQSESGVGGGWGSERERGAGFKGRQVVGLEPTPSEQWSVKGKQILGIVPSDGELDLRNKISQGAGGMKKVKNDGGQGLGGWSGNENTNTEPEAKESVIFITLRRRWGHADVADNVAKIVVPSTLTITITRKTKGAPSPQRDVQTKNVQKNSAARVVAEGPTVDFDDQLFAERLRDAYRSLAGPWFLRVLSVRRLRYIRIGWISVWSGDDSFSNHWFPGKPSSTVTSLSVSMQTLLAARGGLEIEGGGMSIFTEEGLLKLFRKPASGKARYGWVHWARRVAATGGGDFENRGNGAQIGGIEGESSCLPYLITSKTNPQRRRNQRPSYHVPILPSHHPIHPHLLSLTPPHRLLPPPHSASSRHLALDLSW
jgi:hypothetical protein